jgi:hypothetical protein
VTRCARDTWRRRENSAAYAGPPTLRSSKAAGNDCNSVLRFARNFVATLKKSMLQHFLFELFTAIVRPNPAGPLQPRTILLPDPPSTRRLVMLPNGIGKVEDPPLRKRIDDLFDLLHGLNPAGIRQCPKCSRLFSAWRKDQRASRTMCANRIRVNKCYRAKKIRAASGTR